MTFSLPLTSCMIKRPKVIEGQKLPNHYSGVPMGLSPPLDLDDRFSFS